MKCEYCGGKENLKVVCKACLGESEGPTALFAASVEDFRGSYVRSTRRGLKMSQSKFAKRIGVSPVTIARWETGDTVPSDEKIQSLLSLTKQISEGDTHEE